MENHKKPPLGLRPESLSAEERLTEIIGAITRYTDSRYPIPLNWVTEYNRIVKREKKAGAIK